MKHLQKTIAAAMFLFSLITAGCVADTNELPAPGLEEKIRYGFFQWDKFIRAGVSEDEFMAGMENIGLTILVGNMDETGPRIGRLAHQHGIRYYGGIYTSNIYQIAEQQNARLAVNSDGLTCPEEFAIHGGTSAYGSGRPAYVPCPLDEKALRGLFAPALQGAMEGWLDGASIDMEPYGAYSFDLYGETICYCDDCFSSYLKDKELDAQIEPSERFVWLEHRDLIDEYLLHLQNRLTNIYRTIAEEIREYQPTFGFTSYPDWVVDSPRDHWRLQALAVGLNSPAVPFIVVNSTPYWENHNRPWWEAPHLSYQALGLKHVMGSWDGGLMGHHPEVDVSAARSMYEMAMASDGFWRWGERNYNNEEWHSVALANRMIRQVESRIGEHLLHGQPVLNFVTIVEQTGNLGLENALISRTLLHDGRYLVQVTNGNTDWPVTLRLRFPNIDRGKTWRVYDPIHDTDFAPSSSICVWDYDALFAGLVVPLAERGELFLMLEEVGQDYKADPYTAVRSMSVRPHRPRQPAPRPVAVSLQKMFFDDFSNDLNKWDTARVDSQGSGHQVSVEDGTLVIDAARDRENGRGFLTTAQSFADADQLLRLASPGDVIFRIQYDVVSSSSEHSGATLFGVNLNGNDAEGTMMLDAMATSAQSGKAVSLYRWPQGRDFYDNANGPASMGLSYSSSIAHQPQRSIRIDFVAGDAHIAAINVYVNDVLDGSILCTQSNWPNFTSGPVGFWILADRDVTVDNFAVSQIDPSPINTQVASPVEDVLVSVTAGTTRPIVYTSTVDGSQIGYQGANLNQQYVTAIAVADTSAGTSRTIYRTQGYCRQPSLSLDGSQIATSVYVNGRGQIYLVDVQNGRPWNISDNQYCDRNPVFSPDGSKIAFESDRKGNWEIYIMNRDGSNQCRLSNCPGTDREPAFSPDGSRLTYICNEQGDYDVMVVELDSGETTAVVQQRGSNEYEPVWSPDGQSIACTTQSRQLRRIIVASAYGSDHRFLPSGTTGPQPFGHGAPTDIIDLCYSPDGTAISGVFTDYFTSGVFVLNVQTGLIMKLLDAKPLTPYARDWYSTGSASSRWILKQFSGLQFSADGRHLVFSSNFENIFDKISADHWSPVSGSFAIYTLPLPNWQPEQAVDIAAVGAAFLPAQEGGDSHETQMPQPVRLPGTATVWPADIDY